MQKTEKRSYKQTLNLPKTPFAMKANLVQREPLFQQRWDRLRLYERMLEQRRRAEPFILHDGPPYANGPIHLGHLLNKVLKDLVVRSRCMLGHETPFIPGWDCHGLPIEHKVLKEMGPRPKLPGAAREMAVGDIRARCRADAEKFIDLQSRQMRRLGTIGDYEKPYITMDPAYEAAVLEVFAELVGKGLVYRQLKPVHWSIENRTALADAELEYEDRQDTSIYVMFEIDNPESLPERLNARPGLGQPSLMIWTTTPWTLPANLAVAAAPAARYTLCRFESEGRQSLILLADDLADKVLQLADPPGHFERLGYCTGEELEQAGVRYRHPFMPSPADMNKDEVEPSGAFVIDTSDPDLLHNVRSSGAYVEGDGGFIPNEAAMQNVFRIVTADYVTLDDGTGLVHTAPGHGVEDYQTGLANKLPIYCPVKSDGAFNRSAPTWLQGKSVWEANNLIVEHLRESGHLFHDHTFTHSYPHDWRSKTPTIFRATEQWFIGVDRPFSDTTGDDASLRKRAIESIKPLGKYVDPRVSGDKVDFSPKEARALERHTYFIPGWGRNRMRGMLENRPDWCISRQRSWGLPIPAFFPPQGVDTGSDTPYLLTAASVRAVAEKVRRHGSDYWFSASPADLLADYNPAADPDAPDWVQSAISHQPSAISKGRDILDVWFESGSSWAAVLVERMSGRRVGEAAPRPQHSGAAGDPPANASGGDLDAFPADLYLEGSDQHRGWFQSSLLPALGAAGRPPYKAVLTHGFMVDKFGRKMSKSLGNTVEVEDLLRDFGADVCRWWVASLNTDNDIKVDPQFFRIAGEEYRKVRNTIRFLLGNLGDFNPAADRRPLTADDRHTLDAWAHFELQKLIAAVRRHYEAFAYRRVHDEVFRFCNETMSAVYLAAVKDRLYCDRPDSDRRRRTQTVMHEVADALIRLIAPILVHTADEAWLALRRLDENSNATVHTELLPAGEEALAADGWAEVIALRDRALKHLEDARAQRGIDNPLDAGIEVAVPPETYRRLSPFLAELAELCGVSRFTLDENGEETIAVENLAHEPRCERSWKRDGTVKQRSDGGWLSDRDAEAIGLG